MKKRSLVAAIAMLVVSAIVLTSSTYAWFASNAQAGVGEMSANVSSSDGSLQVKATTSAVSGSTWKTALTSSDYTGYASSLTPVSMSLAENATEPAFASVTYDGGKFVDSTATTSGILHYGFDLKCTNKTKSQGVATAKTVNLTCTFAETGSNNQYPGYTKALVKISTGEGQNATSTFYKFFSTGSYSPLLASAITGQNEVTDTNANAIVDSADTGYSNAMLGDTAGATAYSSAIALNAPADSVTEWQIEVWVWAEGQDPDCVGSAPAGAATMEFSAAFQS